MSLLCLCSRLALLTSSLIVAVLSLNPKVIPVVRAYCPDIFIAVPQRRLSFSLTPLSTNETRRRQRLVLHCGADVVGAEALHSYRRRQCHSQLRQAGCYRYGASFPPIRMSGPWAAPSSCWRSTASAR